MREVLIFRTLLVPQVGTFVVQLDWITFVQRISAIVMQRFSMFLMQQTWILYLRQVFMQRISTTVRRRSRRSASGSSSGRPSCSKP